MIPSKIIELMRVFWCITFLTGCFSVFGEETGKNISNNNESRFSGLQLINEIPSTSVKDQFETGTCWSFSGLSFIESELIRQGKGFYDLSELYVVRCNYLRKAERFVRMHGKANFPVGGEANDVSQVIELYGIVTEDAYPGYGKNYSLREDEEMDKALRAYLDSIVIRYDNFLSPEWEIGYELILDQYMGQVPVQFSYNGVVYTPAEFARSLNLSADNFQLLTSFLHQPFYKPFILEVPDNWSWEKSMNVPLNELVEIIDSALYAGYSIAWALDISERGFCFKKGIACLPAKIYQPEKIIIEDSTAISTSTSINFDFSNPEDEISVSEAMRQEAFDNFSTTDDHLMHIVGSALSSDGKKYYYVKNSWGNENEFDGFLFVSESYFRFKTISIMVNKAAIPASVIAKFDI